MINNVNFENLLNSHLSDYEIQKTPILYRQWQIQSKLSNGNIWIEFGKSEDRLMQYSYPVIEEELTSVLSRVRLLIDLAIKLNR